MQPLDLMPLLCYHNKHWAILHMSTCRPSSASRLSVASHPVLSLLAQSNIEPFVLAPAIVLFIISWLVPCSAFNLRVLYVRITVLVYEFTKLFPQISAEDMEAFVAHVR